LLKLGSILSHLATKKKFHSNNNGKRVINSHTLFEGIYTQFFYALIYGKLDRYKLKVFFKCYIIFITTNAGKHVQRVCITPNMKWYRKQHNAKYYHNNNAVDNSANE